MSRPAPPFARRQPHIAPSVRRWHRTVGVLAALFTLFLALTGLLLLNSDRLGLPTTQIGSPWLLDWYGLRPPPPPRGIQVATHWISQSGSRLYVDTREIGGVTGVLLGAQAMGEADGEMIVVTDAALAVLAADGEVLERLGSEAGLPAGLTASGVDAAGRLVLSTTNGLFAYDAALDQIAPLAAAAGVHWHATQTPPAAIVEPLMNAWRGEGLPLERVVLDLHSGRLFGRPGVLIVNLASLALLFLACSGLVIWVQRRR